jgi:hypothetical protein
MRISLVVEKVCLSEPRPAVFPQLPTSLGHSSSLAFSQDRSPWFAKIFPHNILQQAKDTTEIFDLIDNEIFDLIDNEWIVQASLMDYQQSPAPFSNISKMCLLGKTLATEESSLCETVQQRDGGCPLLPSSLGHQESLWILLFLFSSRVICIVL